MPINIDSICSYVYDTIYEPIVSGCRHRASAWCFGGIVCHDLRRSKKIKQILKKNQVIQWPKSVGVVAFAVAVVVGQSRTHPMMRFAFAVASDSVPKYTVGHPKKEFESQNAPQFRCNSCS